MNLTPIVVGLSWLALPLVVICVLDDWLLRPARQIKALPGVASDSPLMRIAYWMLPVTILAAIWRLLTAEDADFSLVLLLITAISGLVWLIDSKWLGPRRVAQALASGKDIAAVPESGTLDYARSFFPVAAVLLVLRSFLFEPYRIPSDSMMPTLLDGDFIVVNKFAYGLRLPVWHTKIASFGLPKHGDVVVFRWPPKPSINFIKRVVGLPGDHVEVRSDRLIINGKDVPFIEVERFNDGCYVNFQLVEEQLGEHKHQALHCVTNGPMGISRLPGCDRDINENYECRETPPEMGPDANDAVIDIPAGKYLMIGDNRDNSLDGRRWGLVDESLLVGRASRIWFNWDWQRSGGPKWRRIGKKID